MLFWTIVKVSLRSLLANKLRSFLAMLGIIIGVAAVISMLALGAGAQRQVLQRVSSMGTNLLSIRPAGRSNMGVVTGPRQNLTIEDAQAILNGVRDVHEVSPIVRGSVQVKYYNKNTPLTVIGTAITYFTIRNLDVEVGRAFTEGEVEGTAKVAVLGPTVVKNLFGAGDPLGVTIKIKGLNFKVVGVLKAKGERGRDTPDEAILVPYTTAMKRLFGVIRLQDIDVRAADGSNLAQVAEGMASVLRKRHRTAAGADDDFLIFNQAELLETFSDLTRTFTILLGSIAGISMLVGGIGILNIMLVTVTERTREIGVRKAIGAKDRDILGQFLLEAVLMSGLGGLIGVVAGVGGAKVVERVMAFPTAVELSSVLLAMLFAMAVGVFFGYSPARRAAMLNPIEALRYE